ncbi:DDE family transposase [Streptomyces sp. TLI_146]|nr:DDE family transposase [Streptomyces sp. TLI_146]
MGRARQRSSTNTHTDGRARTSRDGSSSAEDPPGRPRTIPCDAPTRRRFHPSGRAEKARRPGPAGAHGHALQQTEECKERYKIRAGVEGAISQAVGRCGLRRSRYRGLARTSLQHQLTGAAINLVGIDAHLTNTPLARTRTSHFAPLRPAGSDPAGRN